MITDVILLYLIDLRLQSPGNPPQKLDENDYILCLMEMELDVLVTLWYLFIAVLS